MQIIKNRRLVEDHWQIVGPDDPLPSGDIIVPLARWQAGRDSLLSRTGRLGLLLNGAAPLHELADDLHHFPLIALEFPQFKDGRCYSHARLLRERYHYQGELRAVGEVLRDQLFFMERCGINSFVLRQDQDPQLALGAFNDFSVKYQSAADLAEPIYRLR
ncbi:MAG: oxidoreductase [Gammaproteobacteria bacterium RBG_16_57_12]|nr:MAG: oxidoreductase [Gammaproteobacteria bacterium RBG_16_57_12]